MSQTACYAEVRVRRRVSLAAIKRYAWMIGLAIVLALSGSVGLFPALARDAGTPTQAPAGTVSTDVGPKHPPRKDNR